MARRVVSVRAPAGTDRNRFRVTSPSRPPSASTSGKAECLRTRATPCRKSCTVSPPSAVSGSADITSPTRTSPRVAPSAACCSSARATVTMNRPIRIHQRPSPEPVNSRRHAPSSVSPKPKPRPARALQIAARARSPFHAHSAARRMRPPSRGAAGIRLNTASTTLIAARYAAMPTISTPASTVTSSTASSPNSAATSRLVSGPAAAIRRSARGVRASLRSFATPPNSHSVMSSTSTSWRRATTAWESSCASRDPRNSSAATTAAAT